MQTVLSVDASTEVRCLGVHIDGHDEPVLVPLLTELPRAQFRALTKALAGAADGDGDADELIDSFFADYIGRDTVDAMKNSDFTRLVRAWTDASQEEAGATVGE